MINGIKTKIVRSGGYWRLIIADNKQALQLAKQVPAFRDDFDGEELVLAIITRNDFIQERPNWEVLDWRIAPDNETISPWLCQTHHSETFVHENWLNTPELKKITDKLRNVMFDGSFVSSGKTLHRVRWNNYHGVVMTEDRYLPDEKFGETHVWQFKEARQMIGDIKRYWADFKGESIMEAKRPNSFENSSSSDVFMSFSLLNRELMIDD